MYSSSIAHGGAGRNRMCGVNEVGDYTGGEWGTAFRACRFVGITGAASILIDAIITTEVT